MFNEDALSDGPHQANVAKRSKSLNPLIYPDWWGGYEESIEVPNPVIEKRQDEEARSWNRKPSKKRGEQESSLDRRLQEAKEAAAHLERMFAENNIRN